MNSRLPRLALAVCSVLVASIVVGAAIVFAGTIFHRWLTETTSPTLALSIVLVGALMLGGLVLWLGQIAFRRVLRPSSKVVPPIQPGDQVLVGELVRLAGGSPVKIIATSLGLGFVLGVSPRLRRAVYRALCA